MSIGEARKLAWDWIREDGDDEETLLLIAETLASRGVETSYRGGKLFVGGSEIESYE